MKKTGRYPFLGGGYHLGIDNHLVGWVEYLKEVAFFCLRVHEVSQPTHRIVSAEDVPVICCHQRQRRPFAVTCCVEALSTRILFSGVLVEKLDFFLGLSVNSRHHLYEKVGIYQLGREYLGASEYKVLLEIGNHLVFDRHEVVLEQSLFDTLEWFVDEL